MKPTRSDKRALYAFMAPAIILILLFFVIPVIYVAVVSLLKWNGITDPAFRGVQNFALLFKDKTFIRSIINNVIWAAVAAADAAFTNTWAANSGSYIVVSAVGGNLSDFSLSPAVTANGVIISGEAMHKGA